MPPDRTSAASTSSASGASNAASSRAWHRACDGRLRREAWVSIARDIRVPNHYHALLELAGETPETAAQIEKDLPRTGATFAAHGFQLKPGEPTWRALRNILTAYAAHDPETGYVQSMNFQAAFLILAGLDEEDAFWCLVALVTIIVPGYFSEGMAAAKLDQRVFVRLVHKHVPAVGLHLETVAPESIVPAIIASQWLLTLFVNVLDTDATMRLWDRCFELRSRAPLFACALALLEPAADDILDCDEMGDTVELLQQLGKRPSPGAPPAGAFSRSGPPENGTDASGSDSSLANANTDVLIERVDALLRSTLTAEAFAREVRRELGRRRNESDARLPDAVQKSTPPLTEMDELVEGLQSNLDDVVSVEVSASAEAREEAERERKRAGRSAEGRAEKETNAFSRDFSFRIAEEDDASSDSSETDWERVPRARSVGMEWAEGVLAAGVSVLNGAGAGPEPFSLSSDVAIARRALREPEPRAATETEPRSNPSPPPPLGTVSFCGSGDAESSLGEAVGTPPLSSSSETQEPSYGKSVWETSLDLVAESAKAVDEKTRALMVPAFSNAYAAVARDAALRPTTVFAEISSRLRSARFAFETRDEEALKEMRLVTRNALAAAAAGEEDAWFTAWHPGNGASESHGEHRAGGPAWTAWRDSACAFFVRRADAILFGLLEISRALERVDRAVGSDEPKPEPKPELKPFPREDDSETETKTASDSVIVVASAVTNPATISLTCQNHAARVRAKLRECFASVRETAAAASRDLPIVAKNRREVAEELGREAERAAVAIETWSAACEARRERKTNAALRAMREAAEEAAAAFSGDGKNGKKEKKEKKEDEEKTEHGVDLLVHPRDSIGFRECSRSTRVDPESLSASFAEEDSRCDAASAFLAEASRSVSRRKNAVARERAAALAVRARAAEREREARARSKRVDGFADACSAALTVRADESVLETCRALGDEIERLGERSRSVYAHAARFWCAWLREALSATALTHVAVLDAAVQRLEELADGVAGRIAERARRERTRPESVLGGFLEDAAELIAPSLRTKSDAAAPNAAAPNAAAAGRVSEEGPDESGGEDTVSENDGAAARLARRSSNPLRDRGARALRAIGTGLESRAAKLSEAFQGTSVNHWSARFKNRAAYPSDADAADAATDADQTSVPSQAATALRAPRLALESPGGSVDRAEPTPTPSPRAAPAAPREPRALQQARDDLRRLERRRDALLERKRRLRELLVETTPLTESRERRKPSEAPFEPPGA
jgi:hypothetical protein